MEVYNYGDNSPHSIDHHKAVACLWCGFRACGDWPSVEWWMARISDPKDEWYDHFYCDGELIEVPIELIYWTNL